jgi:hypothetical protein
MSGVVDDQAGYVSVGPAHQALDRSVWREEEAAWAGMRDGQGKRRFGGVRMGDIPRCSGSAQVPPQAGRKGDTRIANRGNEPPDDEAVRLGHRR